MMESKINIGLSLSRNYDKVTVELVEEPVEYESESELRAKIRQKLKVIREEVELEFTKIQK